jgi:hypothetical protein
MHSAHTVWMCAAHEGDLLCESHPLRVLCGCVQLMKEANQPVPEKLQEMANVGSGGLGLSKWEGLSKGE